MSHSFWSLVAAQCQVFINDNAAKLTLIGLAGATMSESAANFFTSLVGIIILVPFILLTPTAGWLADRFSKQSVLYYVQYLQVAVMLLMILAGLLQSMELALSGFLLLAVHTAIFSTSKQSIIKELVSDEQLGSAVGWIESTAVNAILLGTLAGGILFSSLAAGLGVWPGFITTMGILTIFAVVGLILCAQVQHVPAQGHEPFSWSLLYRHFWQLYDVCKDRPTALCLLGNGYFYGIAGCVFLSLVVVGRKLGGDGGQEYATLYLGLLTIYLGVGIVAGHLLTNWISGPKILLNLVSVGTLGIAIFLAGCWLLPVTSFLFSISLFLMGASGAMFIVPLNAYLQNRIEPERRGEVLSANNLLLNIAGVIAVFIWVGMAEGLGLSEASQFLVYMIPALVVAIALFVFLPPYRTLIT